MKYYKLQELCIDIIDCPHSTPNWKNEGIRVVRNFNLKDGNIDFTDGYFVDEATYIERTKRAVPEEEDIIISREAPMGVVGIVPKGLKCCLGQRLVLLKVNKQKCDPFYLLNTLMSDFVQTQFRRADTTGSIVSNLCIPDLKEIIIPVIERGQREMASFLEMINRKCIINNMINDNLEQQAKLLYDYWFTQFDFPDESGKPYRSSGGKMVWNEQLKRDIPSGWKVIPFLEAASWESNSQPPKSEFIYEPQEGYVRFIQNRDYESNTHITYIPLTKNLSIVDRFDILMDKYGDAGAVRYGIEGAFNVALGKICVHNQNYREYIRSFLSSDGIYNFLHNSCMASTRASLNESNLAILNILIPDEKLILGYEKLLCKIRLSILKNNDETQKLIDLRDWLLPMLMNGQATIND